MKRLFLLWMCICLLPLSLRANPIERRIVRAITSADLQSLRELLFNETALSRIPLQIPFLSPVDDTALYSFQISHILEKRKWNTFVNTCELYSTVPECYDISFETLPTYEFIPSKEFDYSILYPQLPFLQTPKQIQNYFLSANNRWFSYTIKNSRKVIWPQLEQNLEAIQQTATQLEQPQDPLEWMAKRILTPNRKRIYVGEVHLPEIQQKALQFFLTLHQLSPDLPKIILTEFLPAGYEWKRADKSLSPQDEGYYEQHDVPFHLQKLYRPMWDELVSHGFRIIGLEPRGIVGDKSQVHVYDYKNDAFYKQSIWSTMEGTRLRSELWQIMIAKYSQENPKALLIIYTGALHSLYNSFASLSAGQQGEETFVLTFYPDQRIVPTEGNTPPFYKVVPLTDPLERLTGYTVPFPQPMLFFKGPLPPIVGFDGRIKIPVNLDNELRQRREKAEEKWKEQHL